MYVAQRMYVVKHRCHKPLELQNISLCQHRDSNSETQSYFSTNSDSFALLPIEGQVLRSGCWPPFNLSADRDDLWSARRVPILIGYKSVSTEIPQYSGFASVETGSATCETMTLRYNDR